VLLARGISLHIHILYDGRITNKWLKENSVACGMGRQTKAVRLREPKASGFYVSKYISKSLSETLFPKRFKRVRYSNDFPEFEFESKESEYTWNAVHKLKSEIDAIEWFAKREQVFLKVVDNLRQID
jgi:hypothetical protein